MFRRIVWTFVVAFMPAATLAQEPSDALASQIAACADYEACFKLLDENETRIPAHADQFAARLEQFGDRAKQELIRRDLGPEPWKHGWYKAPDHVLRYWKNWSEADLPVIRRIMQSNIYSQVRWVLARMGTERAIQELVDNLARDGGPLQESPLVEIADRAIPYIMNGLSSPDWHNYRWLISDLQEHMNLPAEQWAVFAANQTNSIAARIAHLRALASLPKPSPSALQAIIPLLENNDGLVQTEAVRAARNAHLSVPADSLAKICPVRPNEFTSHGSPGLQIEDEWADCLYDLAMKGDAAVALGPAVMRKFLASKNGYDRAEAATTLGYIGYTPAIPQLTALLDDQDWRVSFAAVRALGWLGAKNAIPSVERIANVHWLVELRSFASDVVGALRMQGYLPKPDHLHGYYGGLDASSEDSFDVNASFIHEDEACKTQRWIWQGQPIRWRHGASGFLVPNQRSNYRAEIRVAPTRGLSGGALSGTEMGEFGGALRWEPDSGDPVTLYDSNVMGLAQNGNGAIAAIGEWGPQAELISNGATGVGFALRVTRDESGRWIMAEAARFPSGVGDLTRVGRDYYAAYSGGRVIVFSQTRIVGLATCSGA
jgi:hypothetical protein